MLIVVFRHGNTFAPGEPVVCAGRQDGLPLVASGVRQAEDAGRALADAGLRLAPVWASPRLRARQFAATLQQGGIVVDDRLDEIDYGPWTGRTRAELQRSGAAAAVHAWDVRGSWPADAGFAGGEDGVRARLQAWLMHATANTRAGAHGVVVAVSHGGTLRYLPTLIGGALPQENWPGPHKVRCGHATVLRLEVNALALLGADLGPTALAHTLRAASTARGAHADSPAPAAIVPCRTAHVS